MELIYIGAEWCASCRTMNPKIQELAKKYGIPYKYLDYDTDLECKQDTIVKLPTIQFIDSFGKKVAEFNTNQYASTEKWLQSNVCITSSDVSDF